MCQKHEAYYNGSDLIGQEQANKNTDQGYDLPRNLQSSLFLKELRWVLD